ncbi:pyruvate phosphate dikinase PEP/pyruvate-binding protein [Ferroglobus placidus DSM 10642]|uniref:Probable phosphoenolpyruvate synthase n=1 Tax=Ferroglobus placidus (strain DSM 10642 / AEDII12DO) TaxID=589924 RepID=D3S138_FERPA|nr:PEP/pyruvate-binding domain-containing protein [Ferroglobus placidus]ADC64274.1 pyruvate phosphate dikinase PEP/pyruvate-binding protein [Ferroglobus placidus DSM 10642]
MKYVKWFDEISKEDVGIAGGKGANLGEMVKAGFPIPPGFVITINAFEEFLEGAKERGKKAQIARIISEVDVKNTEELEKVSALAREIVESTPIPEKIEEEIREAYRKLCEIVGEEVAVAVRSSATAEDVPDASFAGQQETYLWIKGEDEVVKHVLKCWSSLYTPRAIAYRATKGFDHYEVSIAVVVQKMVNSRSSGVMFTLNPTNGDESQIVIESAWGLGEAIVSGEVTPDRFVVDKVTKEILDRTISPKLVWCVYKDGKVVHEEVPEDLREKPSLSDEEIVYLAEIGKKIEEHYSHPMDIEWAIDKDFDFPKNVFILQARPETVWSQKKKEPVIGKKSGFDLLMERALTPFKIPK